jgi:general nucleoside transport system ATP-binding protein
MSSHTPEQRVRLALRGIVKRYPATLASDHVDLTVGAGRVHALLGENGAGKSTLMKIVYGLVRPDAGTIEWDGERVNITSPAQARRLGIGMVFQHFSLFETLTVTENISLALDDDVRPNDLAARIKDVSARYGVPVEPHQLVHSMSVGERQRVEIVRCLLQSPRLLIMDEPTSVLAPQAVLKLFETLRQLASEGVSILYISHKLEEICALCDSATVLRAGRVVGVADPRNETRQSLARMMVGTDLKKCELRPRVPGPVRLQLHDFSMPSADPFGTSLERINLAVREGEIVGIAGVSGNGQRELLAALSGELLGRHTGELRLCGSPAGHLDPAGRRRLGLTFVPEERLGRGSVPAMSLTRNSVLTGSNFGLVRKGLVRDAAARAFTRETIAALQVRGANEDSPAQSLSGGNLQKFIVGRETRFEPKVMLVAQPTWGVDVSAAQLIHQSLIDLRERGVALLVVSEDLDELFMICDQIAVLARGRLSQLYRAGELKSEDVGSLMSGGSGHIGSAGVGSTGVGSGGVGGAGVGGGRGLREESQHRV